MVPWTEACYRRQDFLEGRAVNIPNGKKESADDRSNDESDQTEEEQSAKRVGELLFLSGIGPRVRGSKEIPGVTLDSSGNVVSYDIETQCHAVFENVRLVLEDAGATWQDIVDVTVFLTDMKKDFPLYNRVYAEYFAGQAKPNPTRTTIEVTALPTPIAIELKVIAAVG